MIYEMKDKTMACGRRPFTIHCFFVAFVAVMSLTNLCRSAWASGIDSTILGPATKNKEKKTQSLSEMGYKVGKEVNGAVVGAKTDDDVYHVGEPIWLKVGLENCREKGRVHFRLGIIDGNVRIKSDAPYSAYRKNLEGMNRENGMGRWASLSPGEVETFKVLLNRHFDLSERKEYTFVVFVKCDETPQDVMSGAVKFKINPRPQGWHKRQKADEMRPRKDLYRVGRTLPEALAELEKPQSKRKHVSIKVARVMARDALPEEKRKWAERLEVCKIWAMAEALKLLYQERRRPEVRSLVVSRLKATLGYLTNEVPKDALSVWRQQTIKAVLELMEQEKGRPKQDRNTQIVEWCGGMMGELITQELGQDPRKWESCINSIE